VIARMLPARMLPTEAPRTSTQDDVFARAVPSMLTSPRAARQRVLRTPLIRRREQSCCSKGRQRHWQLINESMPAAGAEDDAE
jgi:hypothetical protein